MADTPTLKVCTKCGEEKDIVEFYRDKRVKGGRTSACKKCKKGAQKDYYRLNRRERCEYNRKYWESNRERLLEYHRAQHAANRDTRNQGSRERYQQAREARVEYARRYREDNPHVTARYREVNRERRNSQYREKYHSSEVFRARKRAYKRSRRNLTNRMWRNRYASDKYYRLLRIQRSLVNRTLSATGGSKYASSQNILGYSQSCLVKRMEVQFKPGMSWDNYGEWHIDHKIPLSSFIARGETRPHILNALSNLQPMWAWDNLSKGARWVG